MALFSKTKNYQYLDKLIQSGKSEIILDHDIKLKTGRLNNEVRIYHKGIKIDRNDLIFDCNGYMIDADREGRLFEINGNNITLKNIRFINGEFHSSEASLIIRSRNIMIENCRMEDNALGNYGDTTATNISVKTIKNGGVLVLINPNLDILERIENTGVLYAPESVREMISGDGKFYPITSKTDNPYDFEYLESLIHSGEREITLEHDILLNLSNRTITVDVDDLIIDGNGHTFDAIMNTRILEITSNNVKLKNITFRNGKSDIGSAILNRGSVEIEECTFTDNESESGAICNDGEMKLNYSKIIRNDSQSCAGAIYNAGKLDIFNCEVSQNTSTGSLESGGGAIYNKGEITAKKSDLLKNIAQGYSYMGRQKRHGGAIYNDGGNIELEECLIVQNVALTSGSAIYNIRGDVCISSSDIMYNKGDEAIFNMEGNIKITSSPKIEHNGMAVLNESGKMRISDSVFTDNGMKNTGLTSGSMSLIGCTISECRSEAIVNSGNLRIDENSQITCNMETAVHNSGILEIVKSQITHNESEYYVISSEGPLKLTDTLISDNKGGSLGVIYNTEELEIDECTITRNSVTDSDVGIIYNKGSVTMMKSEITENTDADKIIKNDKVLKIQGSDFTKNECGIIILNEDDNVLEIFKGIIASNTVEKTLICNQGSCSVDKTLFENNLGTSIFNTGDLTLSNPKIGFYSKSIYNDGRILLKNSPEELKNIISGDGEVEDNKNPVGADFTYLDGEIRKGGDFIILNEDITCRYYERDFFEGGIELDLDNLTIDGNGFTIDGGRNSRIFIITGKNIVLKNITFKNGHVYIDEFGSRNSKGSGILIHSQSNAVLENCIFESNNSSAVYVQNEIKLIDCEFNSNETAMDNNGKSEILNANFVGNETAITNTDYLEITECNFTGNDKCIDNSNVAMISKGEYDRNREIMENTFESKIEGINVSHTKSLGFKNQGKLDIKDCIFTENDQCINNNGTFNVKGCEFNKNRHRGLGGVAISNSMELTADGCTFNGNVAENGEGGAIYNTKKAEITNCTFTKNRAGGQLGGGALFTYNTGVTDIRNCTFEDNSANSGGAVLDYGMHPQSLNGTSNQGCTFKNNSPNDMDYIHR